MLALTELQLAELSALGALTENELAVTITEAQYNLDDDDSDSLIARIIDVLGDGFTAEWLDDYESQPDGTANATIRITRSGGLGADGHRNSSGKWS